MYTSTCGLDGHLSAWSSFWALTICRIDLGSKQFLPSISSRCGPLSITFQGRSTTLTWSTGLCFLVAKKRGDYYVVSTTGYWTARGPLSSQFQPYTWSTYLGVLPTWAPGHALGSSACSRPAKIAPPCTIRASNFDFAQERALA